MTTATSPCRAVRAAILRRLALPLAALGGLLALSGCYYYGPYYPYGWYGYPAYTYAGPPVAGGVIIRGGYGYGWR